MEEGAGEQIPGPLASQPRAHPTAPAQREEELRRARGKEKPQEPAGQVVREEPPPLPSPPLFCRWGG